jgi:Phage Tail Collar Domain
MQRRSFLKGLLAVPFAPSLLRGLEFAAPEPAVATARGMGGFSAAVPPGTILPFTGSGAPEGFLECNGQAVPRFAYRRLYGAIGNAYGVAGPRGMAFRVPDLRARMARPGGPTFAEVLGIRERPALGERIDGWRRVVAAGNQPAGEDSRPLAPEPKIRWVIRA